MTAPSNPFPWLIAGLESPVGHIEIITGPMFSGKTEELIRRMRFAERSGRHVQVFKPRIDDRYDSEKIVTHLGLDMHAEPVSSSAGLLEKLTSSTQVVGIDEAQFFDSAIVQTCEQLANRGIVVIAAGLDQDYQGKPFPPMPQLMAVAEHVSKLYAVCAVCGAPATRSQRVVEPSATILVGGAEAYEPRCRRCFEPREVTRSRVGGAQPPDEPL